MFILQQKRVLTCKKQEDKKKPFRNLFHHLKKIRCTSTSFLYNLFISGVDNNFHEDFRLSPVPTMFLVLHCFFLKRYNINKYMPYIFTLVKYSETTAGAECNGADSSGDPMVLHITPLLCKLHWLSVCFWLQFKMLVITFRALYACI